MSEGPKLTKRTILFIILAVIIMSFLGVLSGMKFIQWRQSARIQKRLDGLRSGESTKIRKGQYLPEIALVALDGSPVATSALAIDGDKIILFVSVSCDPCTEMTKAWYPYSKDLPEGVRIIGICQDPLDYARIYVQRTGFPFPLYCDTNKIFDEEYDMNIYPSVIGAYAGGQIAFVIHGMGEDVTPIMAMKLLKEADRNQATH